MLTSLKASLIGKSEFRHAQGGFVLTFLTQTPAGAQEFRSWVSDEDAAKFPFGKDAEGNEIPQKEYSLILTDMDAADEGAGAALQAHIDELEQEVEVSGEKLGESEQAREAIAQELETKTTEIANLAEELEAAKSDLIAAKEAEANLLGKVETLEEELTAIKTAKRTDAEAGADAKAETPAPDANTNTTAESASIAAAAAAGVTSTESKSA